MSNQTSEGQRVSGQLSAGQNITILQERNLLKIHVSFGTAGAVAGVLLPRMALTAEIIGAGMVLVSIGGGAVVLLVLVALLYARRQKVLDLSGLQLPALIFVGALATSSTAALADRWLPIVPTVPASPSSRDDTSQVSAGEVDGRCECTPGRDGQDGEQGPPGPESAEVLAECQDAMQRLGHLESELRSIRPPPVESENASLPPSAGEVRRALARLSQSVSSAPMPLDAGTE